MPDKEDLIIQLAGVRRGQRDRGRAENVSGYLVESVLGGFVSKAHIYQHFWNNYFFCIRSPEGWFKPQFRY